MCEVYDHLEDLTEDELLELARQKFPQARKAPATAAPRPVAAEA